VDGSGGGEIGIVLWVPKVGVKGTYVQINIYNPGAFYEISRLFIDRRPIGFCSDVQRGEISEKTFPVIVVVFIAIL